LNNQNRDKLKLFLTGLEQRLHDNKDYFKKMTASYTSGTKVFKALISQGEDDKLKINFNGRTDSMDIYELSDRIINDAKTYDSIDIIYEERGSTILINADNKNVKMKYVDNAQDTSLIHENKSMIGDRDYYIKLGLADPLLKEIGILTEDGKIRNDMIRKYNQIDHFIELIDSILDNIKAGDILTVLDCGCGKSYLTFALNYYLKEVKKRNCFFIGLDNSEGVISASQKMAENLEYRNMTFITTDINNYTPDRKIDIVISLHACDTATDQAIGLGIRNGSGAIIAVPCCHREILNQYSYKPFEPLIKQGVFKARMADVLTDSIRSLILESQGYDVSVVEYISPLETPKNLMIRALKTGKKDTKAWSEYKELKKLLSITPTLEKLI